MASALGITQGRHPARTGFRQKSVTNENIQQEVTSMHKMFWKTSQKTHIVRNYARVSTFFSCIKFTF